MIIGVRARRLRWLIPAFVLAAGCDQWNLRHLNHPGLQEMAVLQAQAETAYAADDWPAAEKAYRRLAELVPAQAENWFRLGNLYARQGRHQDAIALYREALVRDPGHARAWHNLGMTQLRVATNTFVEMQQFMDSADPVNRRARQVVDAVTRLLQEEPGDGTTGQ